jgi:hypothetical protein
VRVDGLEEAERDPEVDGDDVQVAEEPAPQERAADRAHAEDRDLGRVRVLGREPERRGVLVVDLVDALVERARVQRLVCEVVEHVLEDEEERELGQLRAERRERHLPCREAEHLRNGVEGADLGRAREDRRAVHAMGRTYCGRLDGEVREEDLLRALPLLRGRGDLVRLELPLAEVGDGVDDDPGDAAAEVDDLTERKSA